MLADNIKSDFEKYQERLLQNIYAEIVMKTPIDTSTLLDGWKIENGSIINDVPYAGFVENGTIHMKPVGMVATTLADIDRITQETINSIT